MKKHFFEHFLRFLRMKAQKKDRTYVRSFSFVRLSDACFGFDPNLSLIRSI
jgi:hypothetical protein